MGGRGRPCTRSCPAQRHVLFRLGSCSIRSASSRYDDTPVGLRCGSPVPLGPIPWLLCRQLKPVQGRPCESHGPGNKILTDDATCLERMTLPQEDSPELTPATRDERNPVSLTVITNQAGDEAGTTRPNAGLAWQQDRRPLMSALCCRGICSLQAFMI